MKLQLPPGASVPMQFTSVAANAPPATNALMFTAPTPVFVSVTFCGVLTLPIAVTGKFSETADIVRLADDPVFAGFALATGAAVPLRLITLGAVVASLSIVSMPVSAIGVGADAPDMYSYSGENVTVMLHVAFAASGVEHVVVLVNGHSVVTRRMFNVELALFVRVIVSVAGWPEFTRPKSTTSLLTLLL